MDDRLTLKMVQEAKDKAKNQPDPKGLYVMVDGVKHVDMKVWMELSSRG
jgi:hypothetical protein